MAPLARPAAAALAALLLIPGISRAQTEQDAQAGIAHLKAQYPSGAQKAALPGAAAAAPWDAAKLEDSKAVVAKAGIAPEKLGWLPANIADLGPAITAASRAVQKLHDENPSNVSATFYGNGTMVNLEESIKAATGLWGGSDMKRGCVSHQGVTRAAVAPVLKDSSLEVHGVFVVRKVSPHHAVIVFPKGTDWKKTGVIFDGWIHQESAPDRMTFTFPDWYGAATWKAELE